MNYLEYIIYHNCDKGRIIVRHTQRFFTSYEEAKINAKDICKAVILLDDYDGLSNWDCYETDSLEKAIEIIDGGYGILPLVA